MNKAYSTLPIILLLISFVFITSCSGQKNIETSSEQNKADKIDEFISAYAEYGKFNGSVLVSYEGKVIFKKGYGMANMEWDIPNETDTKFRIASITKQFTSMLILQLYAENKLALDVPISTYLPDYPKENADQITIHHLLTHTSGTPEFDVFLNYRDIERNRYRPKELVDMYSDQALEFIPGERYQYSNPGYMTLGYIIETITGKPYEEVLQKKIFTPLKMLNSGYDHSYTVLKNRASGYSAGYLRGDYVNTNYISMSIPYAAGSIYSTVEDLYLWDQALYSTTLLDQEYMDLLFQPYISARWRDYAYGWFIAEMEMGKSEEYNSVISHGGGMNGFNTLITRMPSSKSLVLLLNNTGRVHLYQMTVAINGILHDKPYKLNKSVAYSTVKILQEEGLKTGLEYYEEVN